MASEFTLIPAVDVSAGKSVRLAQGNLDSVSHEANPMDVVNSFRSAGANWIHLADIDQAFGRGDNREIFAETVQNFQDINFQVSGGICDSATLEVALSLNPARVNLSSSSFKNIAWLEEIFTLQGEVLAFGLDVLDGKVVPRGSKEDLGSIQSALAQLESLGVKQYVVTDVSRDGMLNGPNLDLLKQVFQTTGAVIIASGGVSSLQDLVSIKSLGFVEYAILGKALYAGNFTLEEALEVVRH